MTTTATAKTPTHATYPALGPQQKSGDYVIPAYRVILFREADLEAEYRKATSPREVWSIAHPLVATCDREMLVLLILDVKNIVRGVNVVSVGDLSSSIVHPREIMKAAILGNASSIILVHNHPSGDPTPSNEDIAVTRRIADAAELMGIMLLDHVVIGDNGRFVSLKERGAM